MSTFQTRDFLSFEKLITPRIMKVVYFIGLAGIALGGLVGLFTSFAAMRYSVMTGLGSILLVVIGVPLSAVVWRMSCECALAFFNVHDRVGEIRDRVATVAGVAPAVAGGRPAAANSAAQPLSVS